MYSDRYVENSPGEIMLTGTAMPTLVALKSNGDPSYNFFPLAAAVGRNGLARLAVFNSKGW